MDTKNSRISKKSYRDMAAYKSYAEIVSFKPKTKKKNKNKNKQNLGVK